MESVVDMRECMWCHEPYHLSDGRYKYCSDECAEKARIAHCEKNFSRNRQKTSEKIIGRIVHKSGDTPAWLTRILKLSKRRAQCAKK